MSEAEKQESQKTVVSFIAGLLIGGLLVWVFSGPNNTEMVSEDTTSDDTTEVMDQSDTTASTDQSDTAATTSNAPAKTMKTGEGAIDVKNQPAGMSVMIDGATFPNDEGWIAVRTYRNDQLGNILGAARFSKEAGLVPDQVPLLVPTVAGNSYAVVFFTEDGNMEFNLATDMQVEGVWETFVAQ